MRPVSAVVALLVPFLTVACATSTALPDERLTDTYSGTVSGVITLPPSVSSSAACSSLTVFATADDGKGGAPIRLGRPSVHPGNDRCSFEISNLPSDVTLGLHVDAPASVICGSDATLDIQAQGESAFSLRGTQERTVDFRAQCGVGHSSR
jgi:hypothetical protein